MNMKPMARTGARRVASALLLLLVVLAAVHAGVWFLMSHHLAEGWDRWVRLRQAQGWQVAHGEPSRGGWPLAATLTLPDVRLRDDGGAGGLAWAVERAVLRVEMADPGRLTVEAPGPGRLRLGGAEVGYTAALLRARVPLDRAGPPAQAEILAGRLRLGLPAGPVDVGSARLDLRTDVAATPAQPALLATLLAEAVEVPGAPPAAFGRRIESLDADIAVTGPVPAAGRMAARAAAWRDGGGTLELRGLTMRWGPVAAAAAATLALDDALQPAGAGTLRLTGAAEAVDALAEAGLIERRAAGAARALLPLMARRPADGGPPTLDLPVTLERRALALGRIPVTRLPLLDWAAAP
jgi:hypothetical protein